MVCAHVCAYDQYCEDLRARTDECARRRGRLICEEDDRKVRDLDERVMSCREDGGVNEVCLTCGERAANLSRRLDLAGRIKSALSVSWGHGSDETMHVTAQACPLKNSRT